MVVLTESLLDFMPRRALSRGGVKHAAVLVSSPGGEVVAAISGVRLRILRFTGFTGAAADTNRFRFRTGGSGGDVMFQWVAASGRHERGGVFPLSPPGWFSTTPGLNLYCEINGTDPAWVNVDYLEIG